MLEGSLVYFCLRAFLLDEAPEDRVRHLEKEVQRLRRSVALGISEGYFVNFTSYVVKDMTGFIRQRQPLPIRSRTKQQQQQQQQPHLLHPASQAPTLSRCPIPFLLKSNSQYVEMEHARVFVIVLPYLNESFFQKERPMNDIFNIINGSPLLQTAAGKIDSPKPGEISDYGRTRAQEILSVKVPAANRPISTPRVGTSNNINQHLTTLAASPPAIDLQFFVDVPTTLNMAVAGAKERRSDVRDQMDAYATDVELFADNLAWRLVKWQYVDRAKTECMRMNDVVILLEFSGDDTSDLVPMMIDAVESRLQELPQIPEIVPSASIGL